MVRLFVICVLAVSAGSAGALVQVHDFSGTWSLVPAQGAPADARNGRGYIGGFYCGADCTIAQTAKSLSVTSRQGTSGTVTFNLDGSPSKNVAAGRGGGWEMDSIASWTGDKLTIKTTKEMTGGAVTAVHVLSMVQGNMIIEATARQGAPPVTLTYRKAEAGQNKQP